jgi:hypothetical protein
MNEERATFVPFGLETWAFTRVIQLAIQAHKKASQLKGLAWLVSKVRAIRLTSQAKTLAPTASQQEIDYVVKHIIRTNDDLTFLCEIFPGQSKGISETYAKLQYVSLALQYTCFVLLTILLDQRSKMRGR